MSKKEAEPSSTPILVVYGLDEKGQAHAGTFFEPDFEQARKAAKLIGLECFQSTASELRPALKNVGTGQAYNSGWGVIPRLRRQRYETLLAVIASVRPTAAFGPADATFPSSWGDIAKDSLVLAQADSAEFGWWPSIVEKVEGPILTLRWKDFEKEPKFKRHISAVALVRPPVPTTEG